MSSGLYNTHKIDFDTTLDLTRLKPYGDTMNDGKVQTSFTLPVKDDARGEEAARQIAKKMGLEEPNVAYHAPLDKEFTFYVVYGSCVHTINYEDIHVITVDSDVMTMEETNDYIREHIGRKVVMVGASTGTDAHTVGIDAIMNRKGFAGHYGVERYEMIEAYNLGSQVPNEEFFGIAELIHNHQVKRIIATHVGMTPEVGQQKNEGTLEVNLIPQGSLAECVRAGGAGLGGVLTPVGVDTLIEDSPLCLGKQRINGKDYLLMAPIRGDFALLGTYKCDEYGNCWYKGTMRNFNTVMATAADTVIAECEYIVPVGEIEPENVHTYGMCVDYIVEGDRK